MPDEIILGDRGVETSETQGTGTYTLEGPVATTVPQGKVISIADAVGDNRRTYYCAFQGEDFEIAIGRAHKGTGGAKDTLERLSIKKSTRPGNAAVPWGSGTRTIFATTPAGALLLMDNFLSEIAAAGAAAQAAACTNINALRIANALSELAASGAAACANIGALRIANAGTAAFMAASRFGLIDTGQAGGTNGKVVRLSAANTWVDAANTDTVDQLYCVAFKMAEGYYLPGNYVPGLSGLTANSVYYLGTGGNITTSAPSPAAGVRRVPIGKAISTSAFFFNPALPVTG